MWSGPRNISTAMMRSFGSRADTSVSDEPFYGAYLKQSGSPHPMAEQVIASMDCDWRGVLAHLTGPNPGTGEIQASGRHTETIRATAAEGASRHACCARVAKGTDRDGARRCRRVGNLAFGKGDQRSGQRLVAQIKRNGWWWCRRTAQVEGALDARRGAIGVNLGAGQSCQRIRARIIAANTQALGAGGTEVQVVGQHAEPRRAAASERACRQAGRAQARLTIGRRRDVFAGIDLRRCQRDQQQPSRLLHEGHSQ
ncbi:MAG: hypothetical protein ACT4NL_16210 [Pseudomarimonas sp.]